MVRSLMSSALAIPRWERPQAARSARNSIEVIDFEEWVRRGQSSARQGLPPFQAHINLHCSWALKPASLGSFIGREGADE